MPRLVITRLSSTQITLELHTEDKTESDAFSPTSRKHLTRWAGACGYKTDELQRLLLEVMRTPTARGRPAPMKEYECPGADGEAKRLEDERRREDIGVRCRNRTQRTDQAIDVPMSLDDLSALRTALTIQAPLPGWEEPLLEWGTTERLAVLDIDYHDTPFEYRPGWQELMSRGSRVTPRPLFWHPSHGRGCKLWYVESNGFTAEELAACAAFSWYHFDPLARVEILSRCRLPGFPRDGVAIPVPPAEGSGVVDVPALQSFLRREATAEQIEEYLAENGWEMKQRYPHDRCLIDPLHVSAQAVSPVVVESAGIKCYSCEGNGKLYPGCRSPGWVPYTRLIGLASNDLPKLIRGRTHWDHARHILKHHFPRLAEPILRAAYRASLRISYPEEHDKAILSAVFTSGKDIVRSCNQWATLDGSVTLAKDHGNILKNLPATWVPTTDKHDQLVYKSSPEMVDIFKQSGFDLSGYGYPSLTPVYGCRIWGQRLQYRDERITYVQRHSQYRGSNEHLAPKYLPRSRRIDIDVARKELERAFPGLPWAYLLLVLAFKGLVEGRATQCPFLFVHGPSGAGKSTVPHIAASIAGDVATELRWVRDPKYFGTQVLAGADAGSIVVVNEIMKEGVQAGLPIQTILDPLLNVTEDVRVHKFHVGAVTLGKVPLMIATDVELPPALGQDVQIGRRFVNVPLDARVEWSASLAKIGRPNLYRLAGTDEALVCDSILSWVIDEFFSWPVTAAEVLEKLGFRTIEASAEFQGQAADIRRFFHLVCSAPALSGSDAERWPVGDWKRIDLSAVGSHVLTDAWYDIATSRDGEGRTASRVLQAADLRTVLGVGAVVRFDAFASGQSLYVRFRTGAYDQPTATNKAVLMGG